MSDFDAWCAPAFPGLAGRPRARPAGIEDVVFPVLGPGEIAEVAVGLRDRGAGLGGRGVADVAERLGRVGARFLDEGDPVRREALTRLPGTSGLSGEMARLTLDRMARDWTAERLRRLLDAELEDARLLDGFVTVRGRRLRAFGPRLCAQVVAGSVPGVGVSALLRSLLAKGPTLLKPGRGDVVLPVLFARALAEEDGDLAGALAVLYWPGGSDALDRAALAEADVVTAYGSDEAVRSLRDAAPVTARFVGYHNRVSVGVVGSGALATDDAVAEAAGDVAMAVACFDQRGCVSPQVVYVEADHAGAEAFAERLSGALAELETRLPGGTLDVDEAAAVQQLRGTAELLASGRVRHGGSGASWTVFVETGERSGLACVGRVVRVRPLADLERLRDELEPLGEHLQTLAVAGLGDRAEQLAAECGRVGVTRITGFRSAPFPAPWWHHDGRGPLVDLLRYAEME